ncbi:MAG: hypothetical protein P0111_01580 [Nitrospira sp.]|nr:hypothetical protein [Nitrospira sp.]
MPSRLREVRAIVQDENLRTATGESYHSYSRDALDTAVDKDDVSSEHF